MFIGQPRPAAAAAAQTARSPKISNRWDHPTSGGFEAVGPAGGRVARPPGGPTKAKSEPYGTLGSGRSSEKWGRENHGLAGGKPPCAPRAGLDQDQGLAGAARAEWRRCPPAPTSRPSRSRSPLSRSAGASRGGATSRCPASTAAGPSRWSPSRWGLIAALPRAGGGGRLPRGARCADDGPARVAAAGLARADPRQDRAGPRRRLCSHRGVGVARLSPVALEAEEMRIFAEDVRRRKGAGLRSWWPDFGVRSQWLGGPRAVFLPREEIG